MYLRSATRWFLSEAPVGHLKILNSFCAPVCPTRNDVITNLHHNFLLLFQWVDSTVHCVSLVSGVSASITRGRNDCYCSELGLVTSGGLSEVELRGTTGALRQPPQFAEIIHRDKR